ncbi:hypothetical protein [Streptomyces sp. RTGN2]|nr:hypothetical protein [Streptomyces sp. RTGN2]
MTWGAVMETLDRIEQKLREITNCDNCGYVHQKDVRDCTERNN